MNQFFVVRNGAVATKQVYAGSSRVVSKLVKQEKTSIDKQNGDGKPKGSAKGVLEKMLYFYHPDHLGSSAYVTDAAGDIYQHLEYFAFGETFIEQASNIQRTPYHFTAKEEDEETGLYYFGARYYDARVSVWASVDPILGDYLPTGDKEKDGKLPSMGGVFNSFNLGLYSYGHLNPVKYVDPDGNQTITDDNLSNSKPSLNDLTKSFDEISQGIVKLKQDTGDLLKGQTIRIPTDNKKFVVHGNEIKFESPTSVCVHLDTDKPFTVDFLYSGNFTIKPAAKNVTLYIRSLYYDVPEKNFSGEGNFGIFPFRYYGTPDGNLRLEFPLGYTYRTRWQ